MKMLFDAQDAPQTYITYHQTGADFGSRAVRAGYTGNARITPRRAPDTFIVTMDGTSTTGITGRARAADLVYNDGCEAILRYRRGEGRQTLFDCPQGGRAASYVFTAFTRHERLGVGRQRRSAYAGTFVQGWNFLYNGIVRPIIGVGYRYDN